MITVSGLSPSKENALLRSSVALTYAHWEGFVKSSATAYLEFVAMQRLNYSELLPNFVALAIRSDLKAAAQSKKMDDHRKIVEFFLTRLQSQSSIPYRDAIDTQANLSSAVLKDIIATLGIDYSLYSLKEKLMDERLLRTRNQIAHGGYVEISKEEVLELQDEIIDLMVTFANQIANSASMQSYRVNGDESSLGA